MLDGLLFPNRGLLDEALRRCRMSLSSCVRSRLSEAFADEAETMLRKLFPTWDTAKSNAAATQGSGTIDHQFDDDFDLLEVSQLKALVSQYPQELLGVARADSDTRLLIDEVAQVRNANAHSPPVDISAGECRISIERVGRLLRAFALNDAAEDILALRARLEATGAASNEPTVDLGSWSEFGTLLTPEQIDLLDDRVWPSHRTTLLGDDTPLCPYVRRTVDRDIRVRLSAAAAASIPSWEGRVIALVGESKAGKTRSLVENLAQSALNSRTVIWLLKPTPTHPSPLSELVDFLRVRPADRSQLLVVIDDLQFHLAQRDAVGYQDLRFLAEGAAVVAITLHPTVLKGWASDTPTVDAPSGRPSSATGVEPRLRDLLQRRSIRLSAKFDEHEIDRAAEDTNLPADQVARLPETLVATELVKAKVDSATAVEQAVLESARLLQLAAPEWISGDSVLDLAKLWCINEVPEAATTASLVAAFRWAETSVIGNISLLSRDLVDDERLPARAYRLLDQFREPVTYPDWLPEVAGDLAVEDLVSIAVNGFHDGSLTRDTADGLLALAESRVEDTGAVTFERYWIVIDDDHETAQLHLRHAAETGHPDAMYVLASELDDRGRPIDEVRYWYQAAFSAGAPTARVDLAVAMVRRGSTDEGQDLLLEEALRGETSAYMPLAEQFERSGERSKALEWFERARAVGDPRSTDQYRQGRFAERNSQREAAAELYRAGVDHRRDPWCAYALAQLIESESGDASEVHELLSLAESGGHPVAAIVLASLVYGESSERSDAALYVAAVEAGDESWEFANYILSSDSFGIVNKLLDSKDADLGLRLLLVAAKFGRIKGSVDPARFDLEDDQYYPVYLALDDEEWLLAAADAGDPRAKRELQALHGDTEFDESEHDYVQPALGDEVYWPQDGLDKFDRSYDLDLDDDP